MIDSDFKVFLIECNTNPCLEIQCPLLARIVPELLDNSFRIAIDPLFQPGLMSETNADKVKRKIDLLQQIKYTLVFDDSVDGPELKQLFKDTEI
jgi:tubulin monoglycylase TTLL3/8